MFFFSFLNMHFSHLFGEQKLEHGSRTWNKSSRSAFWLHSCSSKRLQRFTFDLKLFLCHICSFCCGIISPLIFQLIPNIGSRWLKHNRNQVNTNTSWNKISIQMSLNLNIVFMWLKLNITKMADLSFHLSQVHKRARKISIILQRMILLAGCGVFVCVWRWKDWKIHKRKRKSKTTTEMIPEVSQ